MKRSSRKNEETALAYAIKHLGSINYERTTIRSGSWRPDIQDEYGVIIHGGVNIENRPASDIWFEMDEQNACRLIKDSRDAAEIWDFARAFCFNNLMRNRPIPKALREFACSLLIESEKSNSEKGWPRPRASETYNNAKRDVILSTVIFEVWLLFDLSEIKACKVVREAAAASKFFPPSELTDIWRKSLIKRRGLPEKNPYNKALVENEAEERLRAFKSLLSRETAS